MSILDTYGIQEVCDVTFYKIDEDGNPTVPALYLDTLKISTLEQTAENTQAIGGKGNAPLIQWDFGKEITFNVQDALFSMKSLAIMYGGDAITPVEDAVTIIVRPVQGEQSSGTMDESYVTIHAGNQAIIIKPSNLVKPGTEPEAFEENPDVPLFQFPWDATMASSSFDIFSPNSSLYLELTNVSTSNVSFDKSNRLIIINLPWDTTPTPEAYVPVPYLPSIPFIMKTEIFTPILNVSDYISLKAAGWNEYYIENGKKALKINPKIYAADGSVKTTYAANESVLISYDIVGVNKNLIPDPYCNVAIYKPVGFPFDANVQLLQLKNGKTPNWTNPSESFWIYSISNNANTLSKPDIIRIRDEKSRLYINFNSSTTTMTFQVCVQQALNDVSLNRFRCYSKVSSDIHTEILTPTQWSWFNNKNMYITLSPEDFTAFPASTTLEYEEYEYFDYDSGATSINITADTFPGTYYVVGDTLARGSENGEDELFQIVIPKAKIMIDNTLAFEAGGDPSVFDFNMRVLKPGRGQPMVRLVKYDVNGEDSEKNVILVHNHILESRTEIGSPKLLSLTIEDDLGNHLIEPTFSPGNLNYTIHHNKGIGTTYNIVAVTNGVNITFYKGDQQKSSGISTVIQKMTDEGLEENWSIVISSGAESITYTITVII